MVRFGFLDPFDPPGLHVALERAMQRHHPSGGERDWLPERRSMPSRRSQHDGVQSEPPVYCSWRLGRQLSGGWRLVAHGPSSEVLSHRQHVVFWYDIRKPKRQRNCRVVLEREFLLYPQRPAFITQIPSRSNGFMIESRVRGAHISQSQGVFDNWDEPSPSDVSLRLTWKRSSRRHTGMEQS